MLMSPTEMLRPAARPQSGEKTGDMLAYGSIACGLGRVLLARGSEGVCAILLGDPGEDLSADLAARYPAATLVADQSAVDEDLARIVRFVENPADGLDLDLDLRGTPFQRRVWDRLRAVPVGRTVTYAQVAREVDPLTSPRAVAAACAANPLALAVPCHRVVRSDGGLAGYRWGIARKRDLLRREAGI